MLCLFHIFSAGIAFTYKLSNVNGLAMPGVEKPFTLYHIRSFPVNSLPLSSGSLSESYDMLLDFTVPTIVKTT